MNTRWQIILDGKSSGFDSFLDAFNYFIHGVNTHLKCEAFTDRLPLAVDAFFYGKAVSGSTTDEEIVVRERAGMLLESLREPTTPQKIEEAARKVVRLNYSYRGKDESSQESVTIDIQTTPDEIELDIEYDDGDDMQMCLGTNAFVFSDERQVHYFHSHQVIVASMTGELIGQRRDIDIRLEESA